ncbi:hypothetical protein BGZ96_003255 [Linnemannia gamsii]|uniref:CCDC174 alpha/beta GRSR domain-containing protein n=1 Tax=Linnemannia gamsii TaxID=64522 RepID=A0ABQ7JJG3_9FUNG|nr:hypothetical protein BGZ96_003255 [Linnemannia gamsii]
MASADKHEFKKGAIVSANSASLIALAAEVAKHDDKFQRVKGVKGGGVKVPRSVKKPTVWQRQNTGLSGRSKRHDSSSSTFPDDSEEAQSARRAAMERKVKMYEMLKRGGGEDIPDNLREELLVEFDDPRRGHERRYDSGSEDEYEDGEYRGRERFSSRGHRRNRSRSWSRSRSRSRSDDWDRDESMRVARDPRDYKDDPWVEHVDEFGRSRLVRQSEIPPPPAPEPAKNHHDAPGIHNPANPFPVFRNQDTIDKEEWIKGATGEMRRTAGQGLGGPGYSQANTVRHYDNTRERRARGVGFYAFSQDEEERARQMRELLEMRTQTETSRSKHRTLKDKRREEIEARKILIQQKRLKSLASTVAS